MYAGILFLSIATEEPLNVPSSDGEVCLLLFFSVMPCVPIVEVYEKNK